MDICWAWKEAEKSISSRHLRNVMSSFSPQSIKGCYGHLRTLPAPGRLRNAHPATPSAPIRAWTVLDARLVKQTASFFVCTLHDRIASHRTTAFSGCWPRA